MTMQLYFSGASPFVRKVDVLLREAGLRDQVIPQASSGSPPPCAVRPDEKRGHNTPSTH